MDAKLVLRGTEDGITNFCITKMGNEEERPKEYISKENYGRSNFLVSLNGGRISKKCYVIYLYLIYEDVSLTDSQQHKECCLIFSGQYYYKGEVYSYVPSKFIKPDTEEKELQTINIYDKGNKMYVYI